MAAAAGPIPEPEPVYHKSEVDLFSLPPVQASVNSGQWVSVEPINTLPNCTYLEFSHRGDGSEYTDLNSSFVKLRVKIINVNEALANPLLEKCEVALVNNALHSLFRQVTLTLGTKSVSVANHDYPYRAYIETLLSYGGESKQSYLQAEGYYKDTAGHMEATTKVTADGTVYNNRGYGSRRALTQQSKTLELKGRLHLDMFQQPRLLINGVRLNLKLNRSETPFCLFGLDGNDHPTAQGADLWKKSLFKVEITHASLELRKVAVDPSASLMHNQLLETTTAKYPIRRVSTKTYHVSGGLVEHSDPQLFTGQIPSRITVALVDHEAYNGTIKTNPFNFQHFNLKTIQLNVDGRPIPQEAITMDYADNSFMDPFLGLFVNTGQYGSDEGNQISREDFDKGYALYCINLKPDLDAEEDHISGYRNGPVGLKLTFSAALPNTINVIAMAEFDNLVEIDRFRNVTMDYQT